MRTAKAFFGVAHVSISRTCIEARCLFHSPAVKTGQRYTTARSLTTKEKVRQPDGLAKRTVHENMWIGWNETYLFGHIYSTWLSVWHKFWHHSQDNNNKRKHCGLYGAAKEWTSTRQLLLNTMFERDEHAFLVVDCCCVQPKWNLNISNGNTRRCFIIYLWYKWLSDKLY